MRSKLILPVLMLAGFACGAYFWAAIRPQMEDTVSHQTHISPELTEKQQESLTDGASILAVVEGEPVESADVDLEFRLYVEALTNDTSLVPSGAADTDEIRDAIRRQLLSGLIERRVLYRFIARDTSFDLDNPARFEECVGQWQKLTAEKTDLIQNAADAARLKGLLCQKSVLTQYLKERVVKSIEVADPEIAEYFESHKADFALPERVVVRQIVLVDDLSAAKIKNRVTKDNFADIARGNSITPEAEKGGLLGPFARGEMPRVFDVAFDLPVGAISQVQKSPYGFHIFMPIKKLPPQAMTLQDSRAKIRAILLREKESQEYSKWVERALASVPVTTGAEKL